MKTRWKENNLCLFALYSSRYGCYVIKCVHKGGGKKNKELLCSFGAKTFHLLLCKFWTEVTAQLADNKAVFLDIYLRNTDSFQLSLKVTALKTTEHLSL